MKKILACIAVIAGALVPTAAGTPASAQSTPPNVVVILSDDQRWDTVGDMPTLQNLIAAHGVTYSNAMVPTSLCCPSRASLLRGQFAHSTRVWHNVPPTGGWTTFVAHGGEESNLATWLDAGGYRTALIGKYLSGYETAPTGYVPPGWDHWLAFVETGYFDYDLVQTNGAIQHHGSGDADYSTDVLASDADGFTRNADPADPLFMYVAPYGPHAPSIPAARHAGSCEDLPDHRPPSYNVLPRNAPRWLDYPTWNATQRERVDLQRRRACEALGSVHDLVGTVTTALADTGRLSKTLLVYLSDNGFMWGEYRLRAKWQPYDAATRVPMVARYDGVLPSGVVDDRLALNVDLAATVEQVTGLTFPLLEGESLLGAPIRSGFVLEATRGIQPTSDRPAYCGWREKTRLYVRYQDKSAEFYNLASDPYGTINKIDVPAAQPKITKMRKAAKDQCDPMPPGFAWARR